MNIDNYILSILHENHKLNYVLLNSNNEKIAQVNKVNKQYFGDEYVTKDEKINFGLTVRNGKYIFSNEEVYAILIPINTEKLQSYRLRIKNDVIIDFIPEIKSEKGLNFVRIYRVYIKKNELGIISIKQVRENFLNIGISLKDNQYIHEIVCALILQNNRSLNKNYSLFEWFKKTLR